MLLGITHRRSKGQVHLVVPKPQGFLREWLFLRAGRHLRQPLRSQQWRLIHDGRLRRPRILGLGIHRGRTCRLPRAEQAIRNGAQQRYQHNRGNFSLRLHGSRWPALYSSTQGGHRGALSLFTFAICNVLFPAGSRRGF